MCKRCGYDPYLAGRVVAWELVMNLPVTTIDEDGLEHVVYVEERKGVLSRCVRHHRGWVTLRLASGDKAMREEKILAYDVE